jgi:F0F1-type ATP synthase assembly protein I
MDDLESSQTELMGMLRQIVDGRVAPVTQRLSKSEEMTATMRLLLDVVAGSIVAVFLVGALLYYLVDKPWPLSLQIPPPHSTERKPG